MQGRLERLIKIAYRGFKSEQAKPDQAHPDEETLACFLEGRLLKQRMKRLNYIY